MAAPQVHPVRMQPEAQELRRLIAQPAFKEALEAMAQRVLKALLLPPTPRAHAAVPRAAARLLLAPLHRPEELGEQPLLRVLFIT